MALLKFPYPKNPEKFWDTVFQESPSRPNGLPINSRESFTWIILKTIVSLVLDYKYDGI